ncbi:MAG TPA: hypothetical protein PLO62_11435, partial [Candidatus Hydrogenedentes bacterium]|nr:hypothetical protein [Candidatus Hydrogenedentota bacterium]
MKRRQREHKERWIGRCLSALARAVARRAFVLAGLWAVGAAAQAPPEPFLQQTPIEPTQPIQWKPTPVEQRVVPAVESSPKQVNVSVKVVEYQTTRGVDTGLSAYFARRNEVRAYGRVVAGGGSITSADLTFPTPSLSGLSVFLDQLQINNGDMEITLQGLVSENRASILSEPRVMVMLGSPIPTVIKTVDQVPYEETAVVGITVQPTTKFRETGVKLRISVPQAIDDDGDWNTTHDTYIMMNVDAEVNEAGQRYVVALDAAAGGQIQVPEFVTRRVNTTVWVKNGQVLILGGMYRNNRKTTVATMPWLPRAEDLAVGLVERVVPGDFIGSPITSAVGSRKADNTRRELVFLIKAEIWKPAFTVAP